MHYFHFLDPRRSLFRLLLPLAALVTLAGYFSPWIEHPAAGLVVLGLDLAEVVKFLYPVQQGDILLWRGGFYLPLVAVSLSLSLNAFRRDGSHPGEGSVAVLTKEQLIAETKDDAQRRPAYAWPLRVALLLLAAIAALNLLPPAWTPRLLLSPEFLLQSIALFFCLLFAAVSPIAALLVTPRTLLEALEGNAVTAPQSGKAWRTARLLSLTRASALAAFAAAAIYFTLMQFRWVLPTLTNLYGQSLETGWGPALLLVGLAGLLAHALTDLTFAARAR